VLVHRFCGTTFLSSPQIFNYFCVQNLLTIKSLHVFFNQVNKRTPILFSTKCFCPPSNSFFGVFVFLHKNPPHQVAPISFPPPVASDLFKLLHLVPHRQRCAASRVMVEHLWDLRHAPGSRCRRAGGGRQHPRPSERAGRRNAPSPI